jgi:dsDNA-specific endonuclease/ATPase MutS2
VVGAYLDECRARGIVHVRIVHGKGIGAIREIVHAALAKRTDVAHWRLDSESGSGWGATLVELRPS